MRTAAESTAFVVRFSGWARFQHAAVILLFGLLLLTGMPQAWPYAGVSVWVIDHLGGVFAARWIHRAAGIAFALLVAAHLGVVIVGLLSRKMKPSMLLTGRDFRDAIDNLKYYMSRTDTPPKFGRFDYRQKFEYWGLIFGSLIMVATGFILYFPIAISQWLPAELIPAAKVMHGYEALFAFLIVLVWHMAGAHLSPEAFPIDTSIFTGRVPTEKLRHEHALEYEELVASGAIHRKDGLPNRETDKLSA
jgi:cytochrome b subunit of formate dehydrogenase